MSILKILISQNFFLPISESYTISPKTFNILPQHANSSPHQNINILKHHKKGQSHHQTSSATKPPKKSLKKPKFSLPNKQKTAQKRTDSHLTSTKPSDSSTTTNRQQKRTKSNNHKQIIIKNNLIATITNHQTPNETLTTVPPSKTDTRQAKSGKPKGLTFHR